MVITASAYSVGHLRCHLQCWHPCCFRRLLESKPRRKLQFFISRFSRSDANLRGLQCTRALFVYVVCHSASCRSMHPTAMWCQEIQIATGDISIALFEINHSTVVLSISRQFSNSTSRSISIRIMKSLYTWSEYYSINLMLLALMLQKKWPDKETA